MPSSLSTSLTRNDFIIIARILAVIWVGLAFVVMLREVAGTLTINNWSYSVTDDIRHLTYYIWVPWIVMSPIVVLAIKRFLFLPDRLTSTLTIHLFLATFFAIIHLAAVAYHYEYFVDDQPAAMRVYAGWQHMGHFLVADPFILTDVIIYVLFVTSFNITGHIELVRQKEQVASRLETHLAESKLRALQMQINPHFLFNTLNSITALLRKKEVETAEEMIHRLSDFFRMTLERNIGQTVPFELELELVENYLAIEQERFKDRLEIRKNIDPRTLSVDVPAFLLQPLVENSIKHGINGSSAPGLIEIRSSFLGDRILVEVIDNGAGPNSSLGSTSGHGIGLNNVKERLLQLYEGKAVFDLAGESNGGTRVTIELPMVHTQTAGSMDTVEAIEAAQDEKTEAPLRDKLLTPRKV